LFQGSSVLDIEGMESADDIVLNNVPASFIKVIREAIRPGCLFIWQAVDRLLNLSFSERSIKFEAR
jgi:hypothetical protein